MTSENPFPYDFSGIDSRATSLFREQIRAKIKALKPYEADKKTQGILKEFLELDTALMEHHYAETLKENQERLKN